MSTVHDSANSSSEGPATHRRLLPRGDAARYAPVLPVLRFVPFGRQDCCIACPTSITEASAAKLLMPRGSFGYLCPACLTSSDDTLRARMVHMIGYWRDQEAKDRAKGFDDPTFAMLAADLIALTASGFTIHRDGIELWLDQIDVCANQTVRAAVEAAVLGEVPA